MKKVILCVDDEKFLLSGLKAQLKGKLDPVYSIETSEGGGEALEFIDEIILDGDELPVVISDQIMPGMKGDEFLIQVHNRLPRTVLIMLTGQANADAVGRALNEAGLYRYIAKPWDHTDLILTIKEALRKFYNEKTLEEQKSELESLIGKLNEYNESLEKKVSERTMELNHINAGKDKLFAVLGHDLKNSLTALMSLNALLKTDYQSMEDDDRLACIERTGKAINEMNGLLDHLLEWTRIQSGKYYLKPSDFELSSLANEMVSLMNTIARNKNISISHNVSCDTLVNADRHMIGTVLRNLLTNAVKYSHPDSEIRILCSQISNGDGLKFQQIIIEDQGIGMDSVRIESLFKIDKMQTTAGTANEKGTGLGLLICKDLVEINGGTLNVKSEPGKGSSFFFTIPASNQFIRHQYTN